MENQIGNKEDTPSFCKLPTETLLKICSYLPARDLVLNLSRVCSRFYRILSDERVWKKLLLDRLKLKYPIVTIDDDLINWKKACFDVEKERSLWESKDKTVSYVVDNGVHVAAVDAVVFINESICISGSRDRSMVIWNPKKRLGRLPNYVQKDGAHQGWIWRLRYHQNRLYSCSWDNTVKVWTLNAGDMLLNFTFKCSHPVLSLALMDNVIISGDFGRTVNAFDLRCKEEPIFTYCAHTRPVLTLGSTDTEVISGSEDKTLAVYDIRKNSIIQNISFGKSFPNCLLVEKGYVYVGNSKGSLRIFSHRNGSMKSVAAFNMGHQKPISVIKNDLGHLVTGSLDGTVKIFLPTRPPKIITTIKTIRGEVGGLDYHNGILAVGASNFVQFWLPKK